MSKKSTIDVIAYGIGCLLMLGMVYFGIACAVFEFRHPHANRMVVWRHIDVVLAFDVVEEYQ